jgi:hypothetical protein
VYVTDANVTSLDTVLYFLHYSGPQRFLRRRENKVSTMISGFRRDADEICTILGYNAGSSGNPLPMFRDNVSVPSSRVKKS